MVYGIDIKIYFIKVRSLFFCKSEKMPFKQYKIYNTGWFWRTTMMDQTNATSTTSINERRGTESLAVNAFVATYLGLFTLFLWYQQFHIPYIYTEHYALYWEVIKLDPFSEVAKYYINTVLRDMGKFYLLQWAILVVMPVISSTVFFVARFKLKKLPMHEAAEGGKLSVLGRVLSQFIENKAKFFMLFVIGYSFFATSAFANWMVELVKGEITMNVFVHFLPMMSLVLVFLFLRPFVAFYVITIHKKVST